MAGNLLMSIGQDERERAMSRSRKFQTDYESDIATAEDRGMHKRSIEIAQKLLKRNRPIDEIMEDTGLTFAEIENLQ